jgi:hypothetical protein
LGGRPETRLAVFLTFGFLEARSGGAPESVESGSLANDSVRDSRGGMVRRAAGRRGLFFSVEFDISSPRGNNLPGATSFPVDGSTADAAPEKICKFSDYMKIKPIISVPPVEERGKIAVQYGIRLPPEHSLRGAKQVTMLNRY